MTEPVQYTAIPLHAKIVRLLVNDLANNMSAEQAQDTESLLGDDENEWEDVDEGGGAGGGFSNSQAEFQYLSDMFAELDAQDDDEENNPELKNDPIYQTDMRAYLVDFFRNCSAHNINHFMDLCRQHLNDQEREVLEQALKN